MTKTKTCSNCNTFLSEDDTFCNSCGQKYTEPKITDNHENTSLYESQY